MPHVTVKMHPGRTDEQKNKLTQAIADSVVIFRMVVFCLSGYAAF